MSYRSQHWQLFLPRRNRLEKFPLLFCSFPRRHRPSSFLLPASAHFLKLLFFFQRAASSSYPRGVERERRSSSEKWCALLETHFTFLPLTSLEPTRTATKRRRRRKEEKKFPSLLHLRREDSVRLRSFAAFDDDDDNSGLPSSSSRAAHSKHTERRNGGGGGGEKEHLSLPLSVPVSTLLSPYDNTFWALLSPSSSSYPSSFFRRRRRQPR